MDIKGKLIREIKEEYKKDVSNFIEINSNDELICYNTNSFSFGMIFIEDFWKSGIHDCKNDPICKGYPCKQYISIGTSEDNNLMTTKKYSDILTGYHCIFYDNKNNFLLKK